MWDTIEKGTLEITTRLLLNDQGSVNWWSATNISLRDKLYATYMCFIWLKNNYFGGAGY